MASDWSKIDSADAALLKGVLDRVIEEGRREDSDTLAQLRGIVQAIDVAHRAGWEARGIQQSELLKKHHEEREKEDPPNYETSP